MSRFKRAIYLGYYLKQLDIEKFKLFLNYSIQKTGKSRSYLITDMIISIFRYNISILEYFQFRFFELSGDARGNWAGTGYMYEFQRRMNPVNVRNLLEYKPDFLKEYAEFVRHESATIEELRRNDEKVVRLLNNKSGKIVIKRSDGGSGKGIEVISTEGLNKDLLFEHLIRSGNDMVEEYVIQHKELMNLSPSGLNTIRIITQVNGFNEVEIIGCRLRITVRSHVDNMAAGNIAASIEQETGIVNSAAVYSDITKEPVIIHPVTGVKIPGFQIPFWPETMEMVKKAALKNISNRSIGWDIAITDEGPELIEGNHDWCKLLWQLPVSKGLKHQLEKV